VNLSVKKITAAIALATVVTPGISVAQDTFIEEVVVTATKRSQTLQDIPIAVSVTSADTIEKAQIQDLLDLQSVVPSLRVSQLQTSASSNFVIRGFGNGANNVGIEPSVGVFIDGVYRSRSAAAISDLPRLERVEVLSGPQSTLFGKNASAGVVSVVTPKPTGESGGFVSASIGDFNAVVLKGLYEGSINDNLAFDIAATSNTRDGFIENAANNNELNERDRYGVRGQLVWTPNDRLSVRAIADYDDLDESCCGVVNLVSGPATGIINLLGGQLVPNDPEAQTVFFDDESINEITNSGISFQTDYEFENFTATSIVAYRNVDSLSNQDVDFTSADLTNSQLTSFETDTFTSEFRLASNGDIKIDWLIGGFYFDESIEQETDIRFGSAFRSFVDIGRSVAVAPAIQAGLLPASLGTLGGVEAALGLPQGSFFQTNSGTADQSTLDNEAFSIFGSFDWHINDAVTATLGFNYTDDEKEFTITSITDEVRANIPVAGPAAALISTVPTFAINTIDIPNAVEDGRTSDDELTYTLRLAWDVNDSLNIYGSYATGYKATSVNLSRDSTPSPADFAQLQALGLADPNSFAFARIAEPEEAEVFEIGLKARFNRGSLNVAIFDQTLENFQSNIFTGLAFSLINAEEQSVQGAEVSFKYQPTDSFGFGIDATILDPLFDSFTNSSQGDLSGQQPAGISEFSLSVSAQYDFELFGRDSYLRGDYQYEDDVQAVDGISPDIASREVNLLNLSAGIALSDTFNATLWARNLTDDEFLISAFPSVAQAGSFSGYRNEPRTFGVTLRKDF